MEVERRHIPNRLKLHRKIMRLKQKQVAFLLGIHPSDLSKLENGLKMPSGDTLLKLSKIYRTLPAELYSEHDQDLGEQVKVKAWELFGKGYQLHKQSLHTRSTAT